MNSTTVRYRCDLADNLQGKSLEGVTFSSQPAEFDIWISFASSGIIYMVLDGFLDFFLVFVLEDWARSLAHVGALG